MEKASWEISPGHAKTDDDDEDDWEMTLNRYDALPTAADYADVGAVSTSRDRRS
jgi:hypothetical protein